MKLNIIEDEPKSVILEFEEADRGMAELIKDRLLESKDVDFVGVIKEHPEIGKPRLVVKTARSARSLVLKAVDEVQEEVKEMASQMPKSK